MITYPLPSPTQFGISSVTWAGSTNTSRGRSMWTFQDITQVFAGQMWQGTVSITATTEAGGRALKAWLVSMLGSRGTFLLGEPQSELPLGSAKDTPGAPVVNGAAQTGNTLAVRGLPLSATGYLLAGDYIQLGTGATSILLMSLTNVDTDGAGKATIDIFPEIRTSPADADPLIVSSAEGVFTLSRAPTWSIRRPVIYHSVTLAVQEKVV